MRRNQYSPFGKRVHRLHELLEESAGIVLMSLERDPSEEEEEVLEKTHKSLRSFIDGEPEENPLSKDYKPPKVLWIQEFDDEILEVIEHIQQKVIGPIPTEEFYSIVRRRLKYLAAKFFSY